MADVLTVEEGEFVADGTQISRLVVSLKFDVFKVFLGALHEEGMLVGLALGLGRLDAVTA